MKQYKKGRLQSDIIEYHQSKCETRDCSSKISEPTHDAALPYAYLSQQAKLKMTWGADTQMSEGDSPKKIRKAEERYTLICI
eukprot:CAMPEP_0170459284 /NCGR_PEP_ID=MMETSP0123-20130129/6035_1 /TAXON_ID=182087 /ORGANISM="Favella ehrenbergii, Strain Fehren 1" /LENGTH=81 /DNA_ID=CAMNT_0010723841 /DNA_START=134 /DNA_END=379 /DNA_ORIENTATION=-